MARVLLVNPPFYRLLGSHYNANSLGIAYIASFLNANGHDAWLYNADFLSDETYITMPEIARKNLLNTEFSNYTNYFADTNHAIWEEVVDEIEKFDPEWVGYTSYTANIETVNILSKKLRERKPFVRQVIGGVHATLDRNILSKLSAIDFSVRREGEFAMLALVEGRPPEMISGVVTRQQPFDASRDADVIRDIDNLPFPERDKFWNLTEQEKKAVDVSYISTIRGCPYRCNYCASPQHWKRDKTQYRSPVSVIAEMKHLKENYWDMKRRFDYSASANNVSKSKLLIPDNTMVYFVDDIFTIKKERTKTILRMMIDEEIRMPWKCEARADHLDKELCELIQKAGCVRVKLGFESGSDRILKAVQKDETKEDMRRGAELLKSAGVPITAYFMAGFPDETDEDLKQTVEFAKEIDADYYSLSIVAPYFGTKLYYDMIASGAKLDEKPWEHFFHQTGELMANTKFSNKVLSDFLNLNEVNEKVKGYV